MTQLELARLLSRLQATAARHAWGFTPERHAAELAAKERRRKLVQAAGVGRRRKGSR